MEYEPPEKKLTGIMTIRCWNCPALIERHPCSKKSNGAVLHDLCKDCKKSLGKQFGWRIP